MNKKIKSSTDNALNLFHPLIRQWFLEKIGSPTDVQVKAWPEIAQGKHVLVTAPTGSGKTLTAFLWAINTFLTNQQHLESQRVLYLSPLKALNNDIWRNLQRPLEELSRYFEKAGLAMPIIQTAVRSGDTEPAKRRQMLKNPPEILITTPESLNVLLSSKNSLKLLTGISTVILDEIHAVFPNKRGTYLMTAVERLVRICGEFQRIALSATVKPLDKVAEYVGGFQLKKIDEEYIYNKRPVSIVRSHMQKKYHIQVEFPNIEDKKSDNEIPSEMWWHILMKEWRQIINQNHSSLFFTNSRRMVEKVTRLINESEGPPVYSHHGSLSKEVRSVVEKRFKEGELSAIISTSSLELGIDIGSVDEVILIQVPFSIASSIQRIGRSGHGVGEVSKGTFFPIHSRGLIEAAVLAANINNESIETVLPVESPLDVLAQVLLSMTVIENRDIDELFAEIRSSYSFHGLTRKEFDLVLHMLAGRYTDTRLRELKSRLMLDRIKNIAKARDHVPLLLFSSGGVIPDRGYYNMRVVDTKAKVGELDEEFVWERSLGDAFPFGNQIWRIQRITHNDVEVQQVKQSNSLVPFWRADEMNRSYHLSEKIGEFLEWIDSRLDSIDICNSLQEKHYMSHSAASALVNYLEWQKKETGTALPHRHHLVVEHFQDPLNRADSKQVVLHTLWGGPVNRPLAFALSAAWEKKYNYPLNVFVNNDCILLNLPHSFGISEILSLLDPEKLRQLLRLQLESTGYFGARFRINAQRALLLPRKGFKQRMPLWLNRLRSKKLLEAVSNYEDFPILLETWRECLNYNFEIDTLLKLLEEIRIGEIQVTEVTSKKPSPFTEGIIWQQTNQYMYEDDRPESKLRTQLSEKLLQEIIYSSHLRPRFSNDLILSFQEKLHRIAEGYAPDNEEELLQWIRERLYLPIEEWEALLIAIERDHQLETHRLVESIGDRLFYLKKNKQLVAVLALENLPRIGHALGVSISKAKQMAKKLEMIEIFNEDPDDALVGFLSEWLSFYGPISPAQLCQKLTTGRSSTGIHEINKGFCKGQNNSGRLKRWLSQKESLVLAALETLKEEGRIIIDDFRVDKESDTEACLTENLEILLRLRRSEARPKIEPLTIDSLPLFLSTYQGLTSPGENSEDLHQCLENLFGYPVKAGLWETDTLPARLQPYYSSWLETALRENELIWFGCGNEKISFCFESDYDLFIPATPGDDIRNSAEGKQKEQVQNKEFRIELEKLFFETKGKYSFGDLMDILKIPSPQLTSILWQMVWEGQISNDQFKIIRDGVMNRFKPEQIINYSEIKRDGRRHGYGRGRRRLNINRWQSTRPFTGNWYALPIAGEESEEIDALDQQELIKDRIRQLFMRYGVIFREILWNELPQFRWGNVFPILRLMELSGEIVSGYFFKGVQGLQFCSSRALKLISQGLQKEVIYWMNAADPASPCGIGIEELKGLYPHRISTTHLVFYGKKLVLISKKNGKELIFRVDPEDPQIQKYLDFFEILIGRDFQPLKYISVEIVNGESVMESPYKKILREFGFKKDYKAMTLMKKY